MENWHRIYKWLTWCMWTWIPRGKVTFIKICSIQSPDAAGTNGEGKYSKEAWSTVPVWKRWVYCKLLISLFQFICINTVLHQFLPKWLWEQTKSASPITANMEPSVLSRVTTPGYLIHTELPPVIYTHDNFTPNFIYILSNMELRELF